MKVREIVEAEAGVQDAGGGSQPLPDHERLAIHRLPSTQTVLRDLHALDERDGKVEVTMETGNVFIGWQTAE